MWAERLVPRKHGLSSVTLSVTLMSKETVTFVLIIFARLLSKRLKWMPLKFRRLSWTLNGKAYLHFKRLGRAPCAKPVLEALI